MAATSGGSARPDVRSGGAPGAGEVVELGLARAVAAAVRGVPGVADVSPGRFAEAATYGPGEVVRGVVVQQVAGALAVEVRLRARYAPTLVLPALADRVRRAVRAAAQAAGAAPVGRIDVAFDDLRIGEDPEEGNG